MFHEKIAAKNIKEIEDRSSNFGSPLCKTLMYKILRISFSLYIPDTVAKLIQVTFALVGSITWKIEAHLVHA
jgi:hypothetical protein